MLLRVGGLLVISGLILALVVGSTFAAVGAVLILFGGIVLGLAMEPVLAEENLHREVATPPTDSEHGHVAV
jgi:hypothetical protein